jgi:hypothetical protein
MLGWRPQAEDVLRGGPCHTARSASFNPRMQPTRQQPRAAQLGPFGVNRPMEADQTCAKSSSIPEKAFFIPPGGDSGMALPGPA